MSSKTCEVRPDQSIELLKALHILTRDGKMNQDSRRKLKQVYHLYQFIEPLLNALKTPETPGTPGAQGTPDALDAPKPQGTSGALGTPGAQGTSGASGALGAPEPQGTPGARDITLVDHGAGKSYLGFILYDLFFKGLNDGSRVFGIETRAELVAQARELAQRLGFRGMTFLSLSVADSITSDQLPATVDIVTALHACDTATDDAIRFALKKRARYIVVVPCCQAEVAGVLRKNKGKPPLDGTNGAGGTNGTNGTNETNRANETGRALAEIWRRPLHTREFGSQITNVLRCLQLEAHGYQVSVTELVGWEHSMKNELIVAQYQNLPRRRPAQRLGELLQTLGIGALRERFFVDEELAVGVAETGNDNVSETAGPNDSRL